MPIVFKIRKWLDEAEFREILKVSEYVGHENGYRKFQLNLEKALKNGYLFEDIRGIINEYGAVLEGSANDLERVFEEHSPVFTWSQIKGVVKIQLTKLLYQSTRDFLRKIGSKYSDSSSGRVVVEVLPYYAYDALQYFRNLGLSIVDADNIFSDKPLMLKPELKNVALRPYQEEALNKWIENRGRGIISLPTGSGKTLIAIAAIVQKSVRTLVVVYTKEQVFQWQSFLTNCTTIPPGMVGLFYSGEKRLAPITITTYQSGFRNINVLSPYFKMIVVDEVHHLPADKFKHIALHSLAVFRMGLSATPIREDGKHEELFPLLGGIVYYKAPPELVERGFLAPYNIVTVKVKMDSKERAAYEALRKRYRALVGNKEFKQVLQEAYRGNYRAIEALKLHSEMRMLLAKSSVKVDKAVELALEEYRKGSKVIVFTQYVDQAKGIAERVNGFLLIGDTPENERKKVLEQFKSSPSGILVVTTVGDEGLDIPDANVGIIVSGTSSRRQFIQRLGRLLRPKSGGGTAVLYEVILERTPEEFQAKKRKVLDIDSVDEP
ncbi:MAG: DEAD/DEAH box helicase [Desulfurococcaceae archaeon]